MVRELEWQVKEQCAQVEESKASLQKAMQEKAQLEIHLAAASAERQEANRRSGDVGHKRVCLKRHGRISITIICA